MSEVSQLIALLTKSVRAHALYHSNNPAYQRFTDSLRDGFGAIWRNASELRIEVRERSFVWEGSTLDAGEGGGDLAFMFFKDGIRSLAFLPGFEAEVETLLETLHHARHLDPEGDDLITLLWQRDLQAFRYDYIDLLAEGLELPESSGSGFAAGSGSGAAAGAEPGEGGDGGDGHAGVVEGPTIRREDFAETLYFLDPSELRELQEQLRREWERDLKTPLLNALFDRLEDPIPARRREILDILRQLLPVYLGRGDLRSSARILEELETLLEEIDLDDDVREAVDALFSELSGSATLGSFMESLKSGSIDPDAAELELLFMQLRPQALPVLLRASESMPPGRLRDRLRTAIDGIVGGRAADLGTLLESQDTGVALGAARLVGRLHLTSEGPRVARLLDRPDSESRLAAVETLGQIPSSTSLAALQRALEDPDREVRIAAARVLARLRYAPARPRLERLVQGRALRAADITEKIAFFEAYAAVPAPESVEVLDRLLNGRGLFGRRQPVEIRACAAMALGRIASPAAIECLEAAGDETDPVVRNAVGRAMRGETLTPRATPSRPRTGSSSGEGERCWLRSTAPPGR